MTSKVKFGVMCNAGALVVARCRCRTTNPSSTSKSTRASTFPDPVVEAQDSALGADGVHHGADVIHRRLGRLDIARPIGPVPRRSSMMTRPFIASASTCRTRMTPSLTVDHGPSTAESPLSGLSRVIVGVEPSQRGSHEQVWPDVPFLPSDDAQWPPRGSVRPGERPQVGHVIARDP